MDSGNFWYLSNGGYTSLGLPSEISFGFPTSGDFASTYTESNGFAAATATQQEAARLAVQLWDDLIPVSLVEAADGNTADIKVSTSSTGVSYAHAYYPSRADMQTTTVDRISGSVWLREGHGNFNNPSPGNYGFQTIIHELGHALGLDHAGNYNGGSPQYGKTSDGWMFAEDSYQYTVMSYFTASNTGADWFAGTSLRAQTPMLYDVMAIQQIYGVDTTTRTGDTVYGFNRNDGHRIFDFAVNAKPILTIWDAGGTDTIDLSGFSANQTLDLREGAYSDIAADLSSNLAIAYGAVIENGVGGSGDDTITGNDAANVLSGLDGHDILTGGAGDDSLLGGAGDDILRGGDGYDIVTIDAVSTEVTIAEANGTLYISGADGYDTLFDDIEAVQFRDTLLTYAALLGEAETAQDEVFDFAAAAMFSYGGTAQDVSVTTLETGSGSLEIGGNTWKLFGLDYNVTENTVLRFEFRTSAEGEIMGIGLETDSSISKNLFFQLAGSDSWGTGGFSYTGDGDWQAFEIPVGEFFTGNFPYLSIVVDADSGAAGLAEFRDVQLIEDAAAPVDPVDGGIRFDFTQSTIGSLADQGETVAAIERTDNSFLFTGNGWKTFDLNYEVTADTIIRFDFRSSVEGEIQGIGFDSDGRTDADEFFQLAGTQSYGISGFSYTGDGDWQTFEISVGDYLQGFMTSLLVVNDDDGAKQANIEIRDLVIFEESEGPPSASDETLDLSALAISGYAGQDDRVTALERTEDSILLEGNSWKSLAVGYDIDENSYVSFRFRSDAVGEIIGIGFDDDNSLDKTELFQLGGSQSFGIDDFVYTGDGEWQEFLIPLGEYLSGTKDRIYFAADDDGNEAASVELADIRIFQMDDSPASASDAFAAETPPADILPLVEMLPPDMHIDDLPFIA
ncbi:MULTISPECIES: M10 family metallopeptidase [Pacificimonas]|uniref:M10 family metallopeptidase C-terminal domain-containing protein n=1 Tax=Pacificimonas aurantium TaxID=1250540 RepID=A0ABS7WJ62_9SPHN|nr:MULTISPECIES: M10 family metallopeptidase [Pacificimonas]MBZ6377658.1 M10 family metallopeptidase C-terminal domain-containing protein [Pacificimonas aurantium]